MGREEEGGSCAFATSQCLSECASGIVPNEVERSVLKYFQERGVREIVTEIYTEFLEMQKDTRMEKVIQWFVWGDCLPSLTNKVATVMSRLNELTIPQYGFTRNKSLWQQVPSSLLLRIGLTVEDEQTALGISRLTDRMVASPDFENCWVNLIFSGITQAKCSGWQCITQRETRRCDCTQCLNAGEGCFWRDTPR